MFKKFNTTTLLIILVILGGIVALNKFYFSQKSESTFNDLFVKIDTSMVTEILIYPKAENGKEIKISKQGNTWELQNDKVKVSADSNAVRNLINSFAEIKSLSLAGTDKSNWKELETSDTSGSRIKFTTSDNKTFDMVIGKFGYNQAARSGITYIRHADEEAVYAINGFLTFTVNQPFNSWRNKIFIKGNKDSWNSLTFTYPGDSSFVLLHKNNTWFVNNEAADSASIVGYLNSLASIQNSNFVDGYTPASTPVFTLSIQGNNQPAPITIMAYPADSTQKFILHSSLNPDAYFAEIQTHMTEQMFVSKSKFLKR